MRRGADGRRGRSHSHGWEMMLLLLLMWWYVRMLLLLLLLLMMRMRRWQVGKGRLLKRYEGG